MSPRSRFVLRFGVLGYGGGLFFVFNLLHAARLHAHGASLAGLPLLLLVTAVICPLLGYGFGVVLWGRMQRRVR